MSEYINLGGVTYFGLTLFHPESGNLSNADETPRYFLYRNASDTPVISANFTQRSNLIGTYRGSGDITSGNGFAVGDYVEVHASGKVGGLQGRIVLKTFVVNSVNDIRDSILNANLSNFNTTNTVGSGLNKICANIYYAGIKFIKDDLNNNDEYLVQWYRNSLPISSGEVSNPAMSVYNTTTGLATSANKSMSWTSVNNGVLRYNEPTNLVASGEPYLVTASGTIDGSLRVWSNPVGIDYLT